MSTAESLPAELPTGQDADPLLGKVLNDKFKLIALLATGGMGTIYRGEQLTLQRPVAVKVLSPTQVASQVDPNFHKRFFLEASILSRLQHPNIVTVFDYGRIDGMVPDRYFMAMEFLAGETLFRHLRARGRLPPPEAMAIARQIARGLREAHKHGVVHRDLKPSNIMLVPGEEGGDLVKILDFGLVKVLADDSEELTQQGAFLGSPRYMSPEQISHGKVDLRTDVYSLGVILYQLLSGKVPFESEKSVQILIAHLQSPVPRMRDRNPDAEVPEALEAFVMSCLSKNPDARPANMDAFIRALSDCAHAIGLSGQFGSTGIVTLDSATGLRASPVPSYDSSIRLDGSHGEGSGSHSHDLTPAPGSGRSPHVEGNSGLGSRGGLRAELENSAAHAMSQSSPGPQPVPAGSGTKKGVAVAAVVALIAAAVVVGSRFGGTPAQPPAPVAAAPQEPKPAAVEAPAPRKTFMLIVESTPAGAEVVENDKVLGKTPLPLTVSNDAVRDQSRSFTVRLAGYVPQVITQGPSQLEEVRKPVTLDEDKAAAAAAEAAKAAAAAEAAKAPVRSNGASPRPPHQPATTSAGNDKGSSSLDIVIQR